MNVSRAPIRRKKKGQQSHIDSYIKQPTTVLDVEGSRNRTGRKPRLRNVDMLQVNWSHLRWATWLQIYLKSNKPASYFCVIYFVLTLYTWIHRSSAGGPQPLEGLRGYCKGVVKLLFDFTFVNFFLTLSWIFIVFTYPLSCTQSAPHSLNDPKSAPPPYTVLE